MSKIKIEGPMDTGEYIEKKVILDNTTDLNDKTGEIFLSHLEEAIKLCRESISEGFRMVDFWSDPDQGVQFILKKIKK
ncbi:MAG: hypothetical protein ACYDEQ_15635 [Desulfocucumaceae bacterium]